MTQRPSETTTIHTRLLQCALEVEHARAYWSHWRASRRIGPQQAFEDYWFGARSLARVKVLLTNFRARFDAFPQAASLLSQWAHMEPSTRALIGHWHLQLSDTLYRRFTGTLLVQRREHGPTTLTHNLVITWVNHQAPGRWATSTRTQLASRLMSCAYSAGLLATNRGPRRIQSPQVPDHALAYLMYLLRGVRFEGTLLSNPYTASVGLGGRWLEERLKTAPGIRFRRQGDVHDFGWMYPDLAAWGEAMLHQPLSSIAQTHRLRSTA